MKFLQRVKLERDRQLNRQRTKQHLLQQLFWECTLKCNLSCQHCGSDCKVSSLQDDMPLTDFTPVLDTLATHLNPSQLLVITTGGEPLVRPDIVECGRAITSRGFRWGMVSNGMLLNQQMLTDLLDAGLYTIAISLDGFEQDHNWMRGHALSFNRAVSAIKLLTQTDNLVWDVITCVNRRNVNQLEEFKQFLISIGVHHWRIFTVFPAGRAKDNPELILTNDETRTVMEFIKQTRLEGKINLSYSCEGFLADYEYHVRDYSFFCQAGINVASVLCDGSISGCLSIRSNYHQGNIYTDNLWEVWNNRFHIYRNHQWMKTNECADCEMWRYCQGNGMHLRDDDGSLIQCNLKKL